MERQKSSTPEDSRLGWDMIEDVARSLPAKHNLVVPKTVLDADPPYARTRLGRPYGARRQYRDERARDNLHVKEYDDRWVVHVDSYHPGKHAIRHLLVDHGFNRFVDLTQWLPHVVPRPVPEGA